MEILLLYGWMKIDGIISFFGIVATVLGFLLAFTAIFHFVEGEGGVLGKWKWPAIISFVLCWAIAGLTPNSKQLAGLVAGYYAVQAIESPEIAKIVQLARKKANEYLDEELKKK